MSTPDLTRWNRAGLARFRYVDGNAATYLEDLRLALAAAFPSAGWQALGTAPPADEAAAEKLRRLLLQYQSERRDLGWELTRALARACHVLTEYLDAYANEGYLGTASQWHNVRRLVSMLDYTPAPPASAATVLALEAKTGKSGKVAKGFQVKHTPADGSAPVVFETLEDVRVDGALNALRLAGYNRSPVAVEGSELTLDGEIKDLAVGQPVVVERETAAVSRNVKLLEARFLTGVEVGSSRTKITLHQPLLKTSGFTRGLTKVHLKPADRLEPLGPAAAGAEIDQGLQLEEAPAGLKKGKVVYVTDGDHAYYRWVAGIEGRRLVVHREVGPLDVAEAYVSQARQISVLRQGRREVKKVGGDDVEILALTTAGDLSDLVGARVADVRAGELIHFEVIGAPYQPVDPKISEGGGYTTLQLARKLESGDEASVNPRAIYVPPAGRQWKVDTYLESTDKQPLPLLLRTTPPKKTSAGDLVVVARGRQLAWAWLDNLHLDKENDRATLTAGGWRQRGGGGPFFLAETTVYSHFKETARLVGWQDNAVAVTGSVLPLASQVPASLEPGQPLVLERSGGKALAVRVTAIDKAKDRLTVKPPVPSTAGLTRGNTTIRGNLVSAGHGESQPAKVLGSGDATLSSQSFVLEKEGISFVADATQPSGVRPDVQVTVAGRTWQGVPHLRDSGPADPHYAVRMTRDGYLRFELGDGRHGRRLPTGVNNVRVVYRVGSGPAGNVDAGGLTAPVKPHPYVEAVRQPSDAAGGNAMETVASMRREAPASVLTLDRAVSLADFTHLVSRHSSVWQARAFPLATTAGPEAGVEVVVVAAEGKGLDKTLAGTLRDFLEKHALPGVPVEITDYADHALTFDADVTAWIKSAEYEPEKVLASVRQALLAAFALRRRRLGQDLFLSEVYQVVEGVAGVRSSRCSMSLSGAPGGQRLEASDRQVLFLDPRISGIALSHREVTS